MDYKQGKNKHQRIDTYGNVEYQDIDGYWCGERDVCHHCEEQREAEGKPYRFAEQRNSFGYYAGRYCDECWAKSGYRDATDPNAEFSELDAGESLHGEPDF